LCVVCGARLWPAGGRSFAVVAALITGLATVASHWTIPRDYPAKGFFTVIFFEILPHSDDPAGDLRDLGLDDSYRRWAGMHAYSDGSPVSDEPFLREFTARTSYTRVGWFYLIHPTRAYGALIRSLGEAGVQRPYLGNYDRGAGRPPFAESRFFSAWGSAKASLFRERGGRYLAFWVAVLGGALLLLWTNRSRWEPVYLYGYGVLIAMGLTAALIASLGDTVDVPRHHFIANAIQDLLIVIGIASAAPSST